MSNVHWWPGGTPYLWVPASTTDGTDISGDSFFIALTLNGADPQPGDWKTAVWDAAKSAPRVQLGVDIPYPATTGSYRPWRKVGDNPETDVQPATNFVIVH